MYQLSVSRVLSTRAKAQTAIAVSLSGETIALGSSSGRDVVSIGLRNGKTVRRFRCTAGTTVLSLFYAYGDLHCVSKNYKELSASIVALSSRARRELLTGKNFDAAACAYPEMIALSWGKQILLVAPQDGTVVGRLDGHDDAIDALASTLDARAIVSVSADQTVKLWSVSTMQCVRSFGLADARSVAFSPSGDLVAIGCTGGQVDLWHLDEDLHERARVVSERAIGAVSFDPEGRKLYAAAWDGQVSIWDVRRAGQ